MPMMRRGEAHGRIGRRIQGVSNNSGTVLMLKIDAALAAHEEAIIIDPMGAN